MNHSEQSTFTFEQIDFGSVLTKLLQQDTITDIMLWENEVWITDIIKGHYRYDLSVHSDEEIEMLEQLLFKIPRQIAIRMQTTYNEGNPILDGEAEYLHYSQLRFSAIHESLCDSKYPAIAIRKTMVGLRINEQTMIDNCYADSFFLSLMEAMVYCGCNVMIGGETGSGKTELLKYIARYICNQEAIITMEDTLEVYLKRLYPDKNVLGLKTNEHYGFLELLRCCLRQNPDWILVSETRGQEVKELCEAAGTGHHLLSTIHTDSAQSIPYRMIDMAKAEGLEADRLFRLIHQYIHIGIYIHYYNDEYGSHRKISEVCEFYIDENGKPQSHLIYYYDYQKNQYLTSDIRSKKIHMKLAQNKAVIPLLEGVFL